MKTVFYLVVCLTWFIVLLPNDCLSANSGKKEKIILEHADTLRSRNDVRELIGHVRVRRAATVIHADRALYHPASGIVTLTGNVKMNEPGRRMHSHRVRFNETTGDFEASKNVEMLVGDSLKVTCELARYTEEANTVDLFNNIIIDSFSDNARITGNRGRWEREKDTAVIDQDPRYTLPSQRGNSSDTLRITSELLTFYHSDKSALFTGNVFLKQTEISANADSLFHMPDSNKTRLMGDPVIRREKDEVSGKHVELYYHDEELERMVVNGDAAAVTEAAPGDVRRNYLSGKDLEMTIVNDSTRQIIVSGDAQGQYHFWDEDDIYHGVNMVVADSIEIFVVSDRTENIALSGRANGTFYPDGMIPEERISK